MVSPSGQVCLGVFLTLIILASILVNNLVLTVWIRVKSLRSTQHFFLISLVVLDLLTSLCWSSLSVSAVVGNTWILPSSVCFFQACMSCLCSIINMQTLCLLALERLFLFFKPSAHEGICTKTFVISVLASVWFLDVNICVFTTLYWAKVRYYPDQFQCIPEYQMNPSHLNFMFALSYGLPILLMVVCYSACFLKVCRMRRRVHFSGSLVLQSNPKGESYVERLKIRNEMFQNECMKDQKKKLDRPLNCSRVGYDKAANKRNDNVKKNQYHMSKEDYQLLKTYVIMSCVYVSTWIPYVISGYIWTYSRYTYIPPGLLTSLVWLSHCSLFVKPMVYLPCINSFNEGVYTVLGWKG